jgi:hypothetical protein
LSATTASEPELELESLEPEELAEDDEDALRFWAVAAGALPLAGAALALGADDDLDDLEEDEEDEEEEDEDGGAGFCSHNTKT